jgi:hypothetical protein
VQVDARLIGAFYVHPFFASFSIRWAVISLIDPHSWGLCKARERISLTFASRPCKLHPSRLPNLISIRCRSLRGRCNLCHTGKCCNQSPRRLTLTGLFHGCVYLTMSPTAGQSLILAIAKTDGIESCAALAALCTASAEVPLTRTANATPRIQMLFVSRTAALNTILK